jgi:hypothetical protein
MRRLAVGVFIGVLIGLGAGIVTAQSFVHWTKSQVLPVVIVKPALGGSFEPKDGSIQFWRKDEVTPMCLVKPGIVGFIPVEGSSIGNTWTKDEVKPFTRVRYSVGNFVPESEK